MPAKTFNVSALPAILFSQLLVIAVVTLVLVWLIHFREGINYNSDLKAKIFNVHPLLMIIGFFLLSGEAVMAFKIIPGKKETMKIVHLTLHFIALVLGIVGTCAVFKYHNEIHIPHMYTLHSWFGLSTIILFGIQWLVSFLSFLWPGANSGTRERLAPWHIFFGIVIFFMTMISSELGLVEKFIFLRLQRNQEALIINFMGLLIFLFAISVALSVVLRRSYK